MPTVVTKTIKPAGGGDYTTAAAALAALTEDLQAADKVLDFECYGGNIGPISPSATLNMDSTRHVRFRAAESARHSGVYDETRATCKGSLNAVLANVDAVKYMKLRGLCLASGSNYVAVETDQYALGATAIDGCVIASKYCIRGAVTADNCIFAVDAGGYAAQLYDGSALRGCTAAGDAIGFKAQSGAVTAKNCIAQNCTDGFVGTFSAASDYNVSDIAGDAPGAHSKTGVVQFVDAAAKDYHLSPADTLARGAGVNLTSSGITTDIDGDARPATGAWDIGADQVVESPTPTPGGGRKPWGRDPWGRPAWGRAAWGRAG